MGKDILWPVGFDRIEIVLESRARTSEVVRNGCREDVGEDIGVRRWGARVGWREISRLAPKLTCSSAQFVDESTSGGTPGQLVGGTGLVQVANFFGALLPSKASLGKI
jgi:hypothetical protein